MKKPRILHKIYAHLFYYFWKPCPICGREFGGHEKLGGVLYTEEYAPSSYIVKAVCEFCGDEARRRNKGFLRAHGAKWQSGCRKMLGKGHEDVPAGTRMVLAGIQFMRSDLFCPWCGTQTIWHKKEIPSIYTFDTSHYCENCKQHFTIFTVEVYE